MADTLNQKVLANKRVLLAIESKPFRDIIVNVCKEQGASAVIFGIGSEIILEIEKFRPDLLFIEYIMAPLDGVGFFAEVRMKHKLKVPAVMLVQSFDSDGIERSRSINVNEIVLVPFSVNDILKAAVKAMAMGGDKPVTGLRFGPRPG